MAQLAAGRIAYQRRLHCGGALITLAANKVGRVMLISVILAVAFDLYWTSLSVRMYTAHNWWRNGWPNYFDVTAVFLLNAFLFLRYKRAADL